MARQRDPVKLCRTWGSCDVGVQAGCLLI